jgi:hypothetical protein
MFDKLSPWRREPAPARPDPDAAALARLRVEVWVEYKRLHLGFAQALNSLTYGHSSVLALIKHAMLAEYEARKLAGQETEGAADLTVGEAMRQTVIRCRAGYDRVTARTFDDKALSGLAEDADPHLLQTILGMTTAPFDTADRAMVQIARKHALDEPERAARFTPEIRKLHTRLRTHFTDLARRAGLA